MRLFIHFSNFIVRVGPLTLSPAPPPLSVSKLAVKSRILLWRIDGKLPLGHVKECSTENFVLQAQC